jgi:FSR family fosmidomycin resistance protein-like MFS transporter
MDLFWTGVLSVVIGIIISSAFPILVLCTRLLPKTRNGFWSFYGFCFRNGLGSALLGNLADATSITYVYNLALFLPLIGIFLLLPEF